MVEGSIFNGCEQDQHGDQTERGVRLGAFMERCERYLDEDGRIVDQAFQPRVGEGLVRCYLCKDRVIGFSEQRPFNLVQGDPSLPPFGMAREKVFSAATASKFAALRRNMEDDWTPRLQRLLHIETGDLPLLWDADFLYGARTLQGLDTHVLCEVNVSCVIPYPLDAVGVIAEAAKQRIVGARERRPAGP
jgi:hypothetical protein